MFSNPQTNVAPSTKPDSRDEEIANLKKQNEELLKKKLTPFVAFPDSKDEIIAQLKQENANLNKKIDLLTETIKTSKSNKLLIKTKPPIKLNTNLFLERTSLVPINTPLEVGKVLRHMLPSLMNF